MTHNNRLPADDHEDCVYGILTNYPCGLSMNEIILKVTQYNSSQVVGAISRLMCKGKVDIVPAGLVTPIKYKAVGDIEGK